MTLILAIFVLILFSAFSVRVGYCLGRDHATEDAMEIAWGVPMLSYGNKVTLVAAIQENDPGLLARMVSEAYSPAPPLPEPAAIETGGQSK